MAKMTPNESHYVLQALLSEGAVRAGQIGRALRGREAEIRSLRARLSVLESSSEGRPGTKSRSAGRSGRRGGRQTGQGKGASAAPAPPARRKMSPKTRALRKLQGKYMGYVRGLKPAEKARVREVREKQGMNAAISLASSLAGRS